MQAPKRRWFAAVDTVPVGVAGTYRLPGMSLVPYDTLVGQARMLAMANKVVI